MGKYSNNRLRYMAIDFLQAYSCNDIRCGLLLDSISAVTGLTKNQCLEKIYHYSRLDEV